MPKRDKSVPYINTLSEVAKKRYEAKIKLCNNIDPYQLPTEQFSTSVKDYPKISHGDISCYLTETTSYLTRHVMRAYKSTESYSFFCSGWVHAIHARKISHGLHLLVSHVNRSQALSEPPHDVWIIANEIGTIVTGHCTCMAGLSEVCSHIGAVLYAVEFIVRKYDTEVCSTSDANVWMPPTIKKVPALKLREISFTSPDVQQKQLEKYGVQKNNMQSSICSRDIENKRGPSSDEISALMDSVFQALPASAILKESSKYSSIVASKNKTSVPSSLNILYNPEFAKLNYSEILQKSMEIFMLINVSLNESLAVEKCTRNQAQSKVWFQQKQGRVTASMLRAICFTDPHCPSISLVKRICYPFSSKFQTKSTVYGCEHEQKALQAYAENNKKIHVNFKMYHCGFFIMLGYPFAGASPDSIVECDCCGKGVVEVKCPFCIKDESIDKLLLTKNSCLVETVKNGTKYLTINKNHSYYYQVQAQLLAVPDAEFCSFVVYTHKDIHIETIQPDQEFQMEMMEKAKKFFKFALLPELISKFFTRHNVLESRDENIAIKACYCNKIDKKNELSCSADDCKIKNFHLNCLMMSEPPKNKKWLCPECNKRKYILNSTSKMLHKVS